MKTIITCFIFFMLLPANGYAQEGDQDEAKVFGLHMITLRPGVTEVAFETFVRESIYPNWNMPGWKISVAKGDRGDRAGRYMVIMEIESVAYRNKMAPIEGPSDELLKYWTPFLEKVGEDWSALSTVPGDDSFYTDYYVIQ